MSEKFLNEEELKKLTGTKQSARQKAVLEKHGIYYITRIDGSVITTWHYVYNPRVGRSTINNEPDFDKIA